MKTKFLALLGIAVFMAALTQAAIAQNNAPTITVATQISLDSMVNVPSVVSDGSGWVVIHIDSDGAPSTVIGAAPVNDGTNTNVAVPIDVSQATPVLYAMLHTDDNEIGVYEFGTVDGADAPVAIDGNVVVVPFTTHAIVAFPQIVRDTFTAANIVTDAPGWLALHQGVDEEPGPVIGVAPLQAGNNADVVVELDGEVTDTLFPMIHVDTGEVGIYEFGSVEGVDSPVVVNGEVAVTGVSTTPAVAAFPQIVVHSENFDISDMAGAEVDETPTFTIASTLSDGPGWVVIHSDNDSAPGPVAGFAPVNDSLTTEIVVELDPNLVTPILWPMLHIDDGEIGVYEFGTVDGADTPVLVGGEILTFPVDVAPTFSAEAQPISEDETITISYALIDANGWIAIHASVDDAPGPVVGVAPLAPGLNTNVMVEIDLDSVDGAATDQVFPMLHYDTGEAGIYEFGTVEGVDDPVVFDGGPVVGSLDLR